MATISDTLKREVKARSITNLDDMFLNDREVSGPRPSRKDNTEFISQKELYLGFEGLELKMPSISFMTKGCLPTSNPSILSRVADSIDRKTFIDLYALPSPCKSDRKSRTTV
jgi:hypothetical protein